MTGICHEGEPVNPKSPFPAADSAIPDRKTTLDRRRRTSPLARSAVRTAGGFLAVSFDSWGVVLQVNMDGLKRQAAARALEHVRDGMKLGLGTGSTAKHFVELLGERVRAGLHIIGVPRRRQPAPTRSVAAFR